MIKGRGGYGWSGSWLVALLSSVWVMGYGSLKSNVSLMSLWVSQVHRGSLKSGGIGWVLNRCGSWQVVVGCVALKLKFLEQVKQWERERERERERDLNGRVPSYEMKVMTACAVSYRCRANKVGKAPAMSLWSFLGGLGLCRYIILMSRIGK